MDQLGDVRRLSRMMCHSVMCATLESKTNEHEPRLCSRVLSSERNVVTCRRACMRCVRAHSGCDLQLSVALCITLLSIVECGVSRI